jgi:hypothetical protein
MAEAQNDTRGGNIGVYKMFNLNDIMRYSTAYCVAVKSITGARTHLHCILKLEILSPGNIPNTASSSKRAEVGERKNVK